MEYAAKDQFTSFPAPLCPAVTALWVVEERSPTDHCILIIVVVDHRANGGDVLRRSVSSNVKDPTGRGSRVCREKPIRRREEKASSTTEIIKRYGDRKPWSNAANEANGGWAACVCLGRGKERERERGRRGTLDRAVAAVAARTVVVVVVVVVDVLSASSRQRQIRNVHLQ